VTPLLRHIAAEYSAMPAQIALAWVLRKDRIIAVPKASSPGHVKQNRVALDIPLSIDDFAAPDRAFPPTTCAWCMQAMRDIAKHCCGLPLNCMNSSPRRAARLPVKPAGAA
jgi:diketogulonate reductase-like aldo/keto reductase